MSEIAEILQEDIAVLNNELGIIFELCNRTDSAFVKKGTEKTANPKRLNAPANMFLPIESRAWTGKRWVKTMYVVGANTIFLEDQSVGKKGDIIPGLKSQKFDIAEERRNSMSLNIRFENGVLNLKKYTTDEMLQQFIASHEDNIEAPHPMLNDKIRHDVKKVVQFTFRPLRKEVKAKKRIDSFEDHLEVMTFVGKLRSKTEDGYKYRRDLINALCAIFEQGQGLSETDDHQKMEIMIQLSNKYGLEFLTTVNETLDEYRLNIADAEKFNILERNSKEVKLVKDSLSTSIKTFTKDAVEDKDRIEELIYFFLGDVKGQENYRQMCGETEVKKLESVVKASNNKKGK